MIKITLGSKEYIIISFCLFIFSLLNAISGDFYIFLMLSATGDYFDSKLLDYNTRKNNSNKIKPIAENLIYIYRIIKQVLILIFVLLRVKLLAQNYALVGLILLSILLENHKLFIENSVLNNLCNIKNMSIFRYIMYSIIYYYLR